MIVFAFVQQPPVGLGMQLSALGNKIEAIKQKQASIGKNIKLQSSKHFVSPTRRQIR